MKNYNWTESDAKIHEVTCKIYFLKNLSDMQEERNQQKRKKNHIILK